VDDNLTAQCMRTKRQPKSILVGECDNCGLEWESKRQRRFCSAKCMREYGRRLSVLKRDARWKDYIGEAPDA